MDGGKEVRATVVRLTYVMRVLIVAHIPFLLFYLRGLWQQTHYQFFPFAIGAFALLFATRRLKGSERWNWLTIAFVSVDILLLFVGMLLNSPWLTVVGLVFGLAGWCFANQDEGYNRSLLYLTLLPALVLRLPLQYDLRVINWLQSLTTSIASRTLHGLGFLHFREGNTLQFPNKSFLVAEACSGVQSLFTILFIAALVTCLKRRSFIHALLLLASGVIFAGIMNTLRVVTIAVAWDLYSIDLSVGFAHDAIGYFYLALAAGLLMSADSFLGLLTDPIPEYQYGNPILVLWNRFVAVAPVTPRSSPDYHHDDDVTPRSRPISWSAMMRPGNWYHFIFGWTEGWLYSRNYRQLWGGIPFIAVGIAGVGLLWWIRHSSEEPLLARYEKAFNAAVANNDQARQEVALRALSSLRPAEPQYRFRVAQHMLDQQRIDEGMREILRLTPETGLGHTEARLWLARQAISPQPVMPMTLDQIEKQLKVILNQAPKNLEALEAHELLAHLYSERKEWKLAEQHMAEAARLDPELNLGLAKLKKALNRDPEDISKALKTAGEALSKKLEVDRENPRIRINLAETFRLSGDEVQAREILASGLEQKDDPLLRKALSDFELLQVSRAVTESPLNREVSGPVVVKALQRDPSSVAGVEMLIRMHRMGAEFSADAVSAAIEYWQKKVQETPDNLPARVRLSQLYLVCGKSGDAASIIRDVIAAHPELRLTLADLLIRSGKPSEAQQFLLEVSGEATAKLEKENGDVLALRQWAEAQMLLEHADEVRERLSGLAEDPAKTRLPADPALAALYGRACIQSFDQKTGYTGDPRTVVEWNAESPVAGQTNEPGDLLQLLADAFACQATTNQAIDRLSRLSLSTHPAASGADELIRQVRLEGTYGAQVLNMLGMHALIMSRFDKAIKYLEQANLQTRGRDPMILNNLATALIRGSAGDKERALKAANDTLALIPDHPDALATRGEVYVALERWSEAVADLTQSLKFRQSSAEVHHLLEKAYTGLGDTQMADQHRQRALDLDAKLSARDKF